MTSDLLMFCPCGCRSIVTLREWLMKDIVHEALEYANADEDVGRALGVDDE